jgi:uncharacterized protein (TIGR03083 family)
MDTGHRAWIGALRASHDHLVAVVEPLTSAEIHGPSYCSDWHVGQVLSHLGSGAEIGLANLNAALAGEEAPSREYYQSVWARWDALEPDEMAAQSIVSDTAHVERLEGLGDDELDALRIQMMGRELDASGIVGMRLNEHVLHTWDVEVVGDPAATLLSAPVELLIDNFGARIGRLARGDKPKATPTVVAIHTDAPHRHLSLKIAEEEVGLDDGEAASSELSIPAEALIRLSFGRLDAAHTPATVTTAGPVDLEALRTLFPGY